MEIKYCSCVPKKRRNIFTLLQVFLLFNFYCALRPPVEWKILEIFDSSEGADLGLEWFSQTNPGFWEFDVLGQGGGSLS